MSENGSNFMNVENQLLYQIALTQVPNLGAVRIKALLDFFGDAQSIFKASENELKQVDGLSKSAINALKNFRDFSIAEQEINFIKKYAITPLFITDKDYPQRLLNCYDPPTMLYYKGKANLNHRRSISIVGTRSCTSYGKEITEKIIQELREQDIHIISGLAVGIDIVAHRAAVRNDIPTIGVLGNGLKRIYPAVHKKTAIEMIEQGGILTEYMHNSKPEKYNFPSRNRIVAGMTDATIVIETKLKGGSMITAEIANSYHRDVFAVPGKITDTVSSGCNYLIQSNKAFLFSDVTQFLFMMGWEQKTANIKKQLLLFETLTAEERIIVDLLNKNERLHIDMLISVSSFSANKLAALLLELELKNVIKSYPGKIYSLV